MIRSMLLSRRNWLKRSIGAAALVASAPLLAEQRGPTPRQVEGPFFPTRNQADKDLDMTRIDGHAAQAQGEVVEISGQVLDTAGAPVAAALVDIWQANRHGRYAHEADPNPAPLDPDFQGWARLVTDAEGRWRVRTIKPGAYPVSKGWVRPPHIHFKVARRGYRELTTQMYFAGNPLNDVDRLLQEVPADQRDRLVVDFSTGAPPQGRFDIVLHRV